MGEFSHTIDAKGRVIIPAKFRDQLGASFVVTRGLDGCLFGYPMSAWHQLEDKLQRLPVAKKDARAFVRLFYSAAEECHFDKQGRINLPQALITHAALDKVCVIVGVGSRLEIWAKSRWDKYSNQAAADFDNIAEDMMDFGF